MDPQQICNAIIALAVVGFIMIAAEIFVPGLILGILGGLCLILAIVLSYIEFGALIGTLTLLGVGTITLIGFFIWLSVFPKTFVGKKITLAKTLDLGPEQTKTSFLHKTGTALTPLKPSGTVLIEGQRVDVVTDGTYVDRGVSIRVIQEDGSKIVVRPQANT